MHAGGRAEPQNLSLGPALGGLAGGFEGAWAAAQEEGRRPGPWLWQGWPCGAVAGKGGRRVNRLEDTKAAAPCHVTATSATGPLALSSGLVKG